MHFKPDEIVYSDSGTVVRVMYPEHDDPLCFTGECLKTGDMSVMWLISKFSRIKPYKMPWDKNYHVQGAISRMYMRGKIDMECCINLLIVSAKVNSDIACGMVQGWAKRVKYDFS